MATTYSSTRGGAGASAKSRTGVVVDYCEFTVPAAGFVINDIVNLFKLPAMARVLQFVVSFPILDTNGVPAARVSVGDTANGATFYVSSANLGTSFSVATDMVFPGSGSGNAQNVVGTRYAADDTLAMKISTAPATAAVAGTIRAWVMYEMDGGSQVAGF